jgi:hypothetical protein
MTGAHVPCPVHRQRKLPITSGALQPLAAALRLFCALLPDTDPNSLSQLGLRSNKINTKCPHVLLLSNPLSCRHDTILLLNAQVYANCKCFTEESLRSSLKSAAGAASLIFGPPEARARIFSVSKFRDPASAHRPPAFDLSSIKKIQPTICRLYFFVPGRGLEPPSPCGRYHLKVVRLPISPPGQ